MKNVGRATLFAGIATLLFACGQTRSESPQLASAGSGVAGATAHGGSSALGGSSGLGDANAGWAGRGDEQPATRGQSEIDISGRWGMFGWEDPVGVALQQAASSLSGTGCGVGTPPVMNAANCSALSGTVSGRNVKFTFPSQVDLLPGDYLTDLVVSEDGARMAGRFGIGSINDSNWIAWLPVKADGYWLDRPANDLPQHNKALDLRLSAAEGNDPRFDPNEVYRISFVLDGIVGDLGAFFASEMRRTSDGQIEVGPVSPTLPELPVALSLTGSGDVFTSVSARLSNGHTFTFEVLPFVGP